MRIVVLAMLVAAAAGTPAHPYEVIEVKDGGGIVGRVTLAGPPPATDKLAVSTDKQVCGTEKPSRAIVVGAEGGLQNVVVRLRGVKRGKQWEAREYALGQSDCRFEPHVLLLPDGADLRILNTDRIAHNVRTYGRGPVFNVGQPRFVEKMLVEGFSRQFSEPEMIRVGCDMHPWMSAYIVVQQHPYYAVTDESGSFELGDVPPGEYRLTLWHETLGEQQGKVTVKPGERFELDFEMEL